MATISVGEHVRVRAADERNWVVERRHQADLDGKGAHLIKHLGQVRWVGFGFHGSLVMAVRQALEVCLKLEPVEFDIGELARHIDDAVARIVQAARPGAVEATAHEEGNELPRLAG
jgi:hypothetical protein